MDLYIIADRTRPAQDILFLDEINKINGLNIYYCGLNLDKNINKNNYKNINFEDYDNFKKKLILSKGSYIVFYNYYGNLDDLNFEYYKLFIFGHFVFYENRVEFLGLKDIYVFDFYRIPQSQSNIKMLFDGINIKFISDINYPSAINYKNYRNLEFEYKYDIFIPLGGATDLSYIVKIIKSYKNLKFIISPINHPQLSKKDLYILLRKIKGLNNVLFTKLNSLENYSKILFNSRVVVLPIFYHRYDLTRISDSLSLGKILLTNKRDCNKHLNGIQFFEGYKELLLKIDNIYREDLYLDIDYRNKIIKEYDKNHNVLLLTKKFADYLG